MWQYKGGKGKESNRAVDGSGAALYNDDAGGMAVDDFFMQAALEEAQRALEAGETPVGAVIVRNGEILARGRNAREQTGDPTAHAEMIALREAARKLGGWRMNDCTLYVTLEPCPMCAGAMVMARLGRLVYGAADAKYGCAGSVYRITEDPAFDHYCQADGGVLADKCAALLNRFFEGRRAQKEERP